jgi:hypothetical protein
VEIYGESSSSGKVIEEPLKIGDMLWGSTDDNEGVIRILEKGAMEVVNKGVKEESRAGCMHEHLLKDVSNNVEQEWGKGVALSEPPATLDPSPWDTVEEDRSLARMIKQTYP